MRFQNTFDKFFSCSYIISVDLYTMLPAINGLLAIINLLLQSYYEISRS